MSPSSSVYHHQIKRIRGIVSWIHLEIRNVEKYRLLLKGLESTQTLFLRIMTFFYLPSQCKQIIQFEFCNWEKDFARPRRIPIPTLFKNRPNCLIWSWYVFPENAWRSVGVTMNTNIAGWGTTFLVIFYHCETWERGISFQYNFLNAG